MGKALFTQGYKIWSVLALGLLCLSPSSAVAMQQDADSIIAERDFPWFDTETKQLRGMPIPAPIPSSVGDRDTIPLHVPDPNQANSQPANTPTAAPNVTTFVNTLVYIAGGVALTGVLLLSLWGFYRREALTGGADKIAKKKRTMKEHIRHLPFEVEEQEGDFRTAAESAFANGDYSKSVIYLYAELLVILDENNLVRLQRGRTNRQYLNAIREHQSLSDYFQMVMTTFEDAFFGKHKISEQRAEACFTGKANFESEATRINAAKFRSGSDASRPRLTEANA